MASNNYSRSSTPSMIKHFKGALISANSSLTRAALKQSLPRMAASQKPALASSQDEIWPFLQGALARAIGLSLTS
eukprot:3140882-Pyramimonas_sp.AAC.1